MLRCLLERFGIYFLLAWLVQIPVRTAYLIPPPWLASSGLGSCADLEGVGDLLQYATTGAAAGASRSVSRALSFPFDTLKTLAQADTRGNATTQKSINMDSLSFRQYFRGVLPIVIGAIPAQATFFTTYHILEVWTNCIIAHSDSSGMGMEQVKFIQRLMIAALASLPTNVFKVPVEVWKQDSQLSNRDLTFQNFVQQATAEARQEEAQQFSEGRITRLIPSVGTSGIGGIYRGGYSMLLREIPYTALQFSFYGALNEGGFFSFEDNSALWIDTLHQSLALHSAIVGTVAAALATFGTQPADVIKTRMMTSEFALRERNKQRLGAVSTRGADSSRASASIIDSAVELYKTRGVAGFFVGLKSRLALTTVGGFVFFGVSSYISG